MLVQVVVEILVAALPVLQRTCERGTVTTDTVDPGYANHANTDQEMVVQGVPN